MDNLNTDRATAELELNKLAVSTRVLNTPTAKPLLEINQACSPQAIASTSFSAKPKIVDFSFVGQPLPLVFQSLKLCMSKRRDAT